MHQYIARFPRVADLNNSPLGIVHGDFFFENTLRTNDDNLVGVIDFGDCFFGSMLHDIAVGAMEFSVREGEQLDIEAFDAFLSPFSSWFAESATDLELFRTTLLANWVRYSTHLIALGLDEGEQLSSLVTIEYNPYVDRFQRCLQPESLAYVSSRFPLRRSRLIHS